MIENERIPQEDLFDGDYLRECPVCKAIDVGMTYYWWIKDDVCDWEFVCPDCGSAYNFHFYADTNEVELVDSHMPTDKGFYKRTINYGCPVF